MPDTESKALVRRYFNEIRNARNHAAAQQVFSSDIVLHVETPSGMEEIRGHEAIRQTLQPYLAAFPDLRYTIEDLIAESDKVVARWRAEGTHRGELFGIPATGKRVSFFGTDVFRVAGVKIVEGWTSYDRLVILQQVGAIPIPGRGRP